MFDGFEIWLTELSVTVIQITQKVKWNGITELRNEIHKKYGNVFIADLWVWKCPCQWVSTAFWSNNVQFYGSSSLVSDPAPAYFVNCYEKIPS